jgi:hypothetical protein
MSIHQETTIPAFPEQVYELLTNGVKFGEVAGKTGKGGGTEGTWFTVHGGWVEGRQIELIPNERVSRLLDARENFSVSQFAGLGDLVTELRHDSRLLVAGCPRGSHQN